jgi:putative intracellular protease/amidase
METRTIINRMLAAVLVLGFVAFAHQANAGPKDPPARSGIRALVLVDDLYGASLNIEDNQNNILENFSSYGWEVTIACCTPEAEPCPWASNHGCQTITAEMRTYQLAGGMNWDVVVVAPGAGHQNLMNCPFALSALAQAADNGIPVAAWCRGVRVLAAADIIDGVEITGPSDFEDEYLSAGATYLGNNAPPTADQNIITCVDATGNRQEMCELIRETVENATHTGHLRAGGEDKLSISLYPNPISTSSTVEFTLCDASLVHIAIFDQQGNMVQDIVKQEFDAGLNRVTFTPSSLRSGCYYVYVFCGGQVCMQKCMVI